MTLPFPLQKLVARIANHLDRRAIETQETVLSNAENGFYFNPGGALGGGAGGGLVLPSKTQISSKEAFDLARHTKQRITKFERRIAARERRFGIMS
jgi:DNA-binding response OmpR family regulator